MPVFAYTASDPQQRTIKGELNAPSRQAAARQLTARGMLPVRLREAGSSGRPATKQQPTIPAVGNSKSGTNEFSARERLPFLTALTALVSSGYPVGEALRLLPRRLKDAQLRALSVALWERLSAGATFSRALEDFPRVFDAQSINLIRAGEATGNVKNVLRRLIQHYTSLQQLHRRVVAALSYPVFICVVAVGVLLFFSTFLLPRLQGLLHSLGGNLPLSTRLLLSASHGLLVYGPVAAITCILGTLALWRWSKTTRGREIVDSAILRLPFIGQLTVEISVQGFCQTLAVLLENGIPTVEALRIAERTVGNQILSRGFRQAADAIVEGQSITRALTLVPRLPDAVLDRFSLAENTGHLAPQLRELSAEMDETLTHRMKALTDVMSTAVLLLAFSFVGFVAYAIVSAVFQVSASFKF